MYGYRGGAGFLPPTEERRGILVFFVLQISSRHQLLPEDQIHHRFDSVLLIVPPVCFTLHLHTAEHEENELHGSRRALHCKLHATLTLHYMQHYTQYYTQHYTLHYTLPKIPNSLNLRMRRSKSLVRRFGCTFTLPLSSTGNGS